MGSRRLKHKQGAPPSLEEFQAKKDKRQAKKDQKPKRRNEDESVDERKKNKRSKGIKKQDPVMKEQEEQEKNLPEVNLKELADARKTLFDDDEEEDLKDEFDLEQEYENEEEDDEQERPLFSDEEDGDIDQLNAANMEALSMKLDEEAELEAEEAEAELMETDKTQPRACLLYTSRCV